MSIGADRPRSTVAFFVIGLVIAVGLVMVVAPMASSDPDGLERVAEDQGFADAARDHDLAGAPLADYGVDGIHDEARATGASGTIGLVLTFAIGSGLFWALRVWRRSHAADHSGDATPPVSSGEG